MNFVWLNCCSRPNGADLFSTYGPDAPDTSEMSAEGVIMLNTELTPATSDRVPRSLALRVAQGGSDAFAGAPQQIDNGDEALYADKCGSYTKGILQTGIGLVDLAAYDTFKAALASGDPIDFQNIVLGGGVGGRTQNGPQ